MGDEAMPADPFREGPVDWSQFASNNFSFFSSHVAAGFSESQALDLTGRYLSLVLSVMMAGAAAQQPEQPGGM